MVISPKNYEMRNICRNLAGISAASNSAPAGFPFESCSMPRTFSKSKAALATLICAVFWTTSAGADDATVPCEAVAAYLRAYAAATPEAATSGADFPASALEGIDPATGIGYLPETESYDNLAAALAALKSRQMAKAAQAMVAAAYGDETTSAFLRGWYAVDARDFGSRLMLASIDPNAKCTESLIFDTATGKAAYPEIIGDELVAGETCDSGDTRFDLLRVGALAYPAATTARRQDARFEAKILLLPRSAAAEEEVKGQCAVTVHYRRFAERTAWHGSGEYAAAVPPVLQAAIASLEKEIRADSPPDMQPLDDDRWRDLKPVAISAETDAATVAAALRDGGLFGGQYVLFRR
jgi:hypothetical protein